MVVSKYDPSAGITDNVWRIGQGYKDPSGVSALDLDPSADKDVRAGTYYLSVQGSCTAAAFCQNVCKCAPCSNLAYSPYSLSVHAISKAEANPQPSCVPLETYAAYGEAQCCYKLRDMQADIMTLKDVSKRTVMIADGAVALSVLIWLLLFAALLYYVCYCLRKGLFPHQALASKDVELATRGDADSWQEGAGPSHLSASQDRARMNGSFHVKAGHLGGSAHL